MDILCPGHLEENDTNMIVVPLAVPIHEIIPPTIVCSAVFEAPIQGPFDIESPYMVSGTIVTLYPQHVPPPLDPSLVEESDLEEENHRNECIVPTIKIVAFIVVGTAITMTMAILNW
jgi:hypothetical protein